MCEASHGASSSALPVSMLTTPPGRSDVASTSVSVIAGMGPRSAATTTHVLPLTIAGATTETRPSSVDCWGASTATTPVGSGTEKSKYGPATGFDEPCTCASLSLHPAYQTQRSIAASTTFSAVRAADVLGLAHLVDELGPSPFEHLGDAVEDLPAVVRRRGRPLRERASRRDDRVARVLA